MSAKRINSSNQIEFEFAPKSTPQLKDIPVGGYFQVAGADSSETYRRVAPVKSLVRSTMVHEVLTRGDCFIVNVASGMLTVASYLIDVIPLNSKISFSHA